MSEPINNEISSHDSYLAAIARMFYIEDKSKIEIANELNISRFKVARCLQEAKNKGIVHISIHAPGEEASDLLAALKEHLHLQHIYLVPSSSDVSRERQTLGKSAAQILGKNARKGHNIGFSWGRTLLPIADYLPELPSATFVQLTGVVGNDPSQSPIEIIAKISRNSGSPAQAKALITPLFFSSPSFVEAIRKEPAVSEVLNLYNHLDMAFLSVGSWQPRVTQLSQHISSEDQDELDSLGACADFGGLFFDATGHYVNSRINKCRLSIDVEQLLATPAVIAVAGQAEKVDAIYSVCASGLPTHLVTTTEVATLLLHKAPIKETVYQR